MTIKNLFYSIVPFVLLAIVGIFLGIIVEVIVYITPFVRMLILLIAGISLLTFPLLIIKKYRHIAGNGMMVLALDVGLLTWFESFSTTYHFAGKAAVIIGSFFLGLGVVPIAIFTSAVNGEWQLTISIILMVVAATLLWMWGNRLLVPIVLSVKSNQEHTPPFQNEDYDNTDDMPAPKGLKPLDPSLKLQ